MKSVTTIADECAEFAQCTLTSDAPDRLRECVKDAFYAGAGFVLDVLETIDRTTESPAQRAEALAPLREEYVHFAQARFVRGIARMLGIDQITVMEMQIERRPAPDGPTDTSD